MKSHARTLAILVGLASAAPLVAAQPAAPQDAEHVGADRLDRYVAATENGLAVHPLFADPAANAVVVRRDGPGEVERHAQMSDIIVAREGSIDILLGGEVEGGRESAPGEWRGGRIVGGHSQVLKAGDVLWIPAGLPHQMILARGASFTYLAIKVKTR